MELTAECQLGEPCEVGLWFLDKNETLILVDDNNVKCGDITGYEGYMMDGGEKYFNPKLGPANSTKAGIKVYRPFDVINETRWDNNMETYTHQVYKYDFGTFNWNPNHHYKFCKLTPIVEMDGSMNDGLGACKDMWYTALVNITENHTRTVNETKYAEFRWQYLHNDTDEWGNIIAYNVRKDYNFTEQEYLDQVHPDLFNGVRANGSLDRIVVKEVTETFFFMNTFGEEQMEYWT